MYWLDDPDAPDPCEPLAGPTTADLAVVGGGYTGLWTALRAKERYPELDVVVLEASTCGSAASGRNGGFCDASLTHGFGNGLARWPNELATLERLGLENLEAIGDTVAKYKIDCGWERTGELTVATAPHHLENLAEEASTRQALGHDVELLDADSVRAEVNSPTYLGALADNGGTASGRTGPLGVGIAPRMPRRRSTDLRTLTRHETGRQVVAYSNWFPSGGADRAWPPTPSRHCSDASASTQSPSTTWS